MRKTARPIAIALAAILVANVVSAAEYRVVVPVFGKKSVNSSVSLAAAVLPPGTVGQDYSGFDFKSVLQVSDSAPFDGSGVAWAVSSGTLPAGLNLGPTGMLSGVPSVAAVNSAPFVVSASYKGKSATRSYTVAVSYEDFVSEEAPVPPSSVGAETVRDGDAELTVSPTKLSFGLVARQLPTAPVTVSLSNGGTAAGTLAIEAPANPEYTVTNNCPALLPVGARCEAKVVFTPKTTATLKSSFNISLGGKVIAVALDGSGRDSSATFSHIPKNQSYQDFGIVAPEQFVARQTIVANSSKYYALALFSAEVTPSTHAGQFAVESDGCPPVLQVGESCSITSRYAPTAQGTHSAYAKLTMNVLSGSRSFNLYGRAAGTLKVTSLSAWGAHLPGGGQMTVSGGGFLPGAKVFFGGSEAVTSYVSTGSLSVTVPAVPAPENTYVQVVNADGAEASSPKPFARARSFAQFTAAGPIEFSKQALNVASPWKYAVLRNSSYFSEDTFEISDIKIDGPYQLDTSSGYCAPGRKVGANGATCTLRVKFVPVEAGDHAGKVTVFGNGETLTLALTGKALGWDGTPSGSGTANTELPYGTVVSGNEPVGGASQTKYVDIFFRNTNPDAQLNASFKLSSGAAFKIYTVYMTNGTSPSGISCVINSMSTSLCRANDGMGTRPHLQLRLSASSAAGLGSHAEELIVLDAAGDEVYRIPLTLDVVYDVTAETYAANDLSAPLSEITVLKANLASEAFKDVYIRNLGTSGMLRTDSVTLVDNSSADIYLKSGVSLYRASSLSAFSSCGQFINSNQINNCLSDDISGSSSDYVHQRVRVFYKPMSSGLRTATLRIVHRGQGVNPLDIPISIDPVELNAVVSGAPASNEVAQVPTLRIGANADVDGSTGTEAINVYFNSGDGLPLKGSFRLSGPGTEVSTSTLTTATVNDTGSSYGTCTTVSRLESSLCSGVATRPHLRTAIQANSNMGEGTYNWTLTYRDPAMQELLSVPITVEIANDAKPELSSSNGAAAPLPNGKIDFGDTFLATAPGQAAETLTKVVYLRNLGTLGKLKVERAMIEGGDAAFSFVNPLYKIGMGGTGYASCNSTRPDAYNVTSCVAYDPNLYPDGEYRHVRIALAYQPTRAGTQNAVLKIWHNSKTVPNPMIVPLTATASENLVAGKLSSSPAATVVPTGVYSPLTATGGTRDLIVYILNGDATGALYAEEVSVTGSAFTLVTSYKSSGTGSAAGCGSVLSADKKSATPCLADTVAVGTTAPRPHMRFSVRCTLASTLPAGAYEGNLRVKTQGALHVLPLSCSKS